MLQAAVAAVYGLATLSGGCIGYLAWQTRDQPGGLPLFGIVVGACWWCGMLFLASQVEAFAVSARLQRSTYLGVPVIVACVVLFAAEYTGRDDLLTARTVGLLSVHPAAVAVFVVLNPGGAFFTSVDPASTVTGVAVGFGVAFWVHALYSYLALTVALLALFQEMYRSRRLYRRQFSLLAASVVITAVANYAYIAGPVSFDTAPLGILFAAGLLTVAITRYRLVEVVPVARQRVLESVDDAVFVADPEGRIVFANGAARTILGGDPEEPVHGRDVERVVDGQPETEALYEELTETQTETRTEATVGDTHVDATATPLAPDREDRLGWLFLVRDVTDREERERELRRRNEQLDRFASVVSHDLRNPLDVAEGYVQLAQETGDLSHLDTIDDAHGRMETIIEDVLTLAREGGEVTTPHPVALSAVAEEAWDNVATDRAALDVAGDETVLADHGRLVRILENLFRNAVEHGSTSSRPEADDAVEHGSTSPPSHAQEDTGGENASEPSVAGAPEDAVEHGSTSSRPEADDAGSENASEPSVANAPEDTVEHGLPERSGAETPRTDGDPPLTVTVEPTDGGFSVADDGTGIPASDHDRVFESGYSTGEEGIGTGLAIVRQLASAHGWTVSATNGADGGARFEFDGVDPAGPPDEL